MNNLFGSNLKGIYSRFKEKEESELSRLRIKGGIEEKKRKAVEEKREIENKKKLESLYGELVKLLDTAERVDIFNDYFKNCDLYGEIYGEIGIKRNVDTESDNENFFHHKKLYYYGGHEQSLYNNKDHRAPTPEEYFEILVPFVNRNMSDKKLWKTAVDIISDEGEFTCYAAKRDANMLKIFEFARALRFDFNDMAYRIPEVPWHNSIKEFNLGKLPVGWNELAELNEANPGLVEYLYSVPYDKLPDAFKKGNDRVLTCFADDGNVWPLMISKAGPYNIGAFQDKAASRGVYYYSDYF